MNFIAPAKGGRVLGTGRIVNRGRLICFMEGQRTTSRIVPNYIERPVDITHCAKLITRFLLAQIDHLKSKVAKF